MSLSSILPTTVKKIKKCINDRRRKIGTKKHSLIFWIAIEETLDLNYYLEKASRKLHFGGSNWTFIYKEVIHSSHYFW